MKQIILGTAGHIDHGKTSLIRALTDVETDRLKEEKERGITIELGFASLDIGDDIKIGIVDMPGHEKFVKNMVAGSSGIDLVVMTIAADEGVMPQTREHMEICTLLDIRYGLVALTKTDLVDEDLLELALEDIQEFTQNTFLAEAPVIPLSSATGEGLDDFLKSLGDLCAQIPERTYSPIFRLPVDRVFSMKGFGTVITGTLISGSVKTGEEITIFPSRITSRVRGIQVHGEEVGEARPGTRTAVNFQGLNKRAVFRGDILSTPDALIPSYMVDCDFTFLKSAAKPLKNRARIRFHTGTKEITGVITLLDREEIQPGDTAFVQFRLEEPVSCIKDDRYVIRSYSPIRTIGGGKILNPVAVKHKFADEDLIRGLQMLSEDNPEESIRFFAGQKRYEGVSFRELRVMTNIPDKKLASVLQKMLAEKAVIQTDKENRIYVHGRIVAELKAEFLKRLEEYHQANPLKEGMPTQELKSKFQPYINTRLFNLVLNELSKADKIVSRQNIVRLSGHEVTLQVDQHETKEKIRGIYKKSGLTPPFFRTVCQEIGLDKKTAKDVLQMLIDEKGLVKTKDDLYFDAGAMEDLREKVVAFLRENGEITTPQFKDMTGISRKFVIPLIEYFDAVNLTIRVGDTRQLRKK